MSKFDKLKTAKQRIATESGGFVITTGGSNHAVAVPRLLFKDRRSAEQYLDSMPNKELYRVASKSVHEKAAAKLAERKQREKMMANNVPFEKTKLAKSVLDQLHKLVANANADEMPSKTAFLRFIGDNWEHIVAK